jgi:hypothetical protein
MLGSDSRYGSQLVGAGLFLYAQTLSPALDAMARGWHLTTAVIAVLLLRLCAVVS